MTWLERLAERQRGLAQVWVANACGWRRAAWLLVFVIVAPPAVWVFRRAVDAGAIANPEGPSDDDPEPIEADETEDGAGGEIIAVKFAQAA